MQPSSIVRLGLAALAVLIGGCASNPYGAARLASGTPLSAVESGLGKPTDVRTVNGAQVWDYVTGPKGFVTYRVSFDGASRVRSVEQLLTEERFLKLQPGRVKREDVAAMFGRPASVNTYPLPGNEVWMYRYRDVTFEKVADLYFRASDGVFLYSATYIDPEYWSGIGD